MTMKIVCEVGSNWKTLDDCLFSIKKAQEAGANYVKFQLFNDFELTGQLPDNSTMGVSPYLDFSWIPHLKMHADKFEIEFMCTAFSSLGYDMVNPFVNVHKIASAELTDISILSKVNSFRKPVMLSTAGSDLDIEVKSALLHLHDCPVTIMYCVADYPAKIIDFRRLDSMKEKFGQNYGYGYSDHSIDVLNIPYIAKEKGCSIIEKHANFCGHEDTDDATHSLNFEEFKLMCGKLRGEVYSEKQTNEMTNKSMRDLHKRRFIAIRDISPGEKFKIRYNVNYYRATIKANNPILTFRPWDIDNRPALNHKRIGDVITYADVDL